VSARDDDFYWEGLARRQLRVRVCDACGRGACPPLPGCPHCGDERGRIVVSSGEGALYTWTVCHVAFDPAFADEVPYIVGAVDLPEGARVLARIDGITPGGLRDALPLRVHWSGEDAGRTRLVFVPATEGAHGGS
jgi:uncharacterized OB-fold protein